MFAPKHFIFADYFLVEGEDPEDTEVYLMQRGSSTSIAGPLHQVGWNAQYIIYTDANLPQPWNVISVGRHQSFKISEQQRREDLAFKSITLLTPASAWKANAKVTHFNFGD